MHDFFDIPSPEHVRELYDSLGKILAEVEAISRGHMGGPEIKQLYQDGIMSLVSSVQALKECADKLRSAAQ